MRCLGKPSTSMAFTVNELTNVWCLLHSLPPTFMLEKGKQANNFFAWHQDEYAQRQYRLKSLEQYSREHGTNEQPGKKYFSHSALPDIIRAAPMQKSSSKSPAEVEKGRRLWIFPLRNGFFDRVSYFRNYAQDVLYRLCFWPPQSEPIRTVDAPASENASIHHRRKVDEAVCST